MKVKRLLILVICCKLCIFNAIAQERNLDYYISQGLANSPLLKDYKNQVRSNVVDSIKLKASLKPQVSLNGLLMVAPVYKGFGYDSAITNGAQYTGVVQISQDIFRNGTLAPQYKSLAIQNEGLANSSKISVRG